MKRVTTSSGAVYLINNDQVKREGEYEKRGDGEWQKLLLPVAPVIADRMVLVMESLVRYGLDDLGTPANEVGPVTTRLTTPVVSIEDVEA